VPTPTPGPRPAGEDELGALVDALKVHKGNVARAAESLGISRQRAYRLIEASAGVDLSSLRGDRRGRG
jgi:transcriptional regulator of acetoin/glycerol metabolism